MAGKRKTTSKKPVALLPAQVSPSLARVPAGYGQWLSGVKARIHAARQRAALSVNHELLAVYWQLGRDIIERQAGGVWGTASLTECRTTSGRPSLR